MIQLLCNSMTKDKSLRFVSYLIIDRIRELRLSSSSLFNFPMIKKIIHIHILHFGSSQQR